MKDLIFFVCGGVLALLNFVAGYIISKKQNKQTQDAGVGRWNHWG